MPFYFTDLRVSGFHLFFRTMGFTDESDPN